MLVRFAIAAALQWALAAYAVATPSVRSFEQFHSAKPTAAGGRLLFNELGCANCHDKATSLPPRRGPDLIGVVNRVKTEWLGKFLTAPAHTHPGSTMPQILAANAPQAVKAIQQYLQSLAAATPPKPNTSRHVNANRGAKLFRSIGCVACHNEWTTPPPFIGEKYVIASLAEVILNPLQSRPDGRMPQITMEAQDAIDIAGYLLKFQGSDGREAESLKQSPTDFTLINDGRKLVDKLRCASCHGFPEEIENAPTAIAHSSGGCMDSSLSGNVPHYELSEQQRIALTLFLNLDEEEFTARESATLTLQALDCMACHERDGIGGPTTTTVAFFRGDVNLGDTGRNPPPLTGVGRKLQTDWLNGVLQGKHRVRPYLQTRMPIYGEATAPLAKLLAEADQQEEATEMPGGDDTAGRKLLGTMGGLGCITCHQWGQRPSLGIQALDISNLGQRLQTDWLRTYLIDPGAHRPGTLMPSFWPNGVAANQKILNGNTDRQIASILSFATSANGEPQGFPIHVAGQFELIPREHPIVLRTFMKDVGTQAILVGFPAGIHLAYDGKNARPAMAWKGKFFDAHSTWFSRFAPFERPLGDSIIKWPQAATADNPPVRFHGYRLDTSRVPTFHFVVSGVPVEERFTADDAGLHRTLEWDPIRLPELTVSHPEGASVTEHPDHAPGHYSFTYRWK
ncbi:MAG: cytochrome c2 [Verrucomicrobiales bacterium]|jgi:cytochrome c2